MAGIPSGRFSRSCVGVLPLLRIWFCVHFEFESRPEFSFAAFLTETIRVLSIVKQVVQHLFSVLKTWLAASGALSTAVSH
jgi:hypothetical protein